MAESGLQQEYSSGGLSDQALHRLRLGEKQEQHAAQNPLYGSEGRRQKFKDLAMVAAKEKTQRGAEFKRLKIQEDEQKRLTEQFKLKFDEQKRQHEQGRADAYQAKKDAEPGFIGKLFGK
jgi:Flp pilus assembly protein TadD